MDEEIKKSNLFNENLRTKKANYIKIKLTPIITRL